MPPKRHLDVTAATVLLHMKYFPSKARSAQLALGLGLSLSSSGALAQNKELNGSDTMLDLINRVLNDCKAIPGQCDPNGSADFITYIGGGSSTGENQMTLNAATNQDIAPMSRPLDNSAC